MIQYNHRCIPNYSSPEEEKNNSHLSQMIVGSLFIFLIIFFIIFFIVKIH